MPTPSPFLPSCPLLSCPTLRFFLFFFVFYQKQKGVDSAQLLSAQLFAGCRSGSLSLCSKSSLTFFVGDMLDRRRS